MDKLNAAQILVKNAKIKAVKLSESDAAIKKIITDTQKKQVEILRLKEVDQTRLKMVVQL